MRESSFESSDIHDTDSSFEKKKRKGKKTAKQRKQSSSSESYGAFMAKHAQKDKTRTPSEKNMPAFKRMNAGKEDKLAHLEKQLTS